MYFPGYQNLMFTTKKLHDRDESKRNKKREPEALGKEKYRNISSGLRRQSRSIITAASCLARVALGVTRSILYNRAYQLGIAKHVQHEN